MNRYFSLASADLVVPNQEAWRLLWDFTTLKEISETLSGNSGLQNKALSVANEIMNVFNNRDLGSIPRARKLAEEIFGEHWDKKGEKIYAEGPERPQIWGIGYCHIDTAWYESHHSAIGMLLQLSAFVRLWPYSVTQQKVARSWSTQVDLMERYPEHRFTCSQAQQFKWLEEVCYLIRFIISFPQRYPASCIHLFSSESKRKFWKGSSTSLVVLGSRTTQTCHLEKHS